jgi:hypothetical protein
MIHGDCSSAGCYAMTDEQIAEIYALARESFFGGQASFQIQAFPFRMTPQNMARHRNSSHMPFWRMLKTGYDHFEVTRQEPKVDVCERRYVFNTESNGRYVPSASCPAMTTPDDVLAAVQDKQRRDEAQVADLVRRGTNLPAVRSFADGSMHPTFLAAVQSHNVDQDGVVRTRISSSAGTIPANVRIPSEHATMSLASARSTTTGSVSEPVVRADPEARTAAAKSPSSSSGGGGLFGNLFSSDSSASSSSSGGGVMDRMARLVGLGGSSSSDKAAPAPKSKAKQSNGKKPADTKKQSGKQPAAPAPRPKAAPAEPEQQTAAAQPSVSVPTISGSQPTVPIGSFDNRFGPWR